MNLVHVFSKKSSFWHNITFQGNPLLRSSYNVLYFNDMLEEPRLIPTTPTSPHPTDASGRTGAWRCLDSPALAK